MLRDVRAEHAALVVVAQRLDQKAEHAVAEGEGEKHLAAKALIFAHQKHRAEQQKARERLVNLSRMHRQRAWREDDGKRNDRPALLQALAHCRLHRATLVIAKLDRLSRDAHFLLGLEKNRLTVGIMAVGCGRRRAG